MIFNFVSSLSLTPFEHYMLADDNARYPMTVFLRLTFTGSVDRNRLQQAFAKAIAFHPLLNAKVVGDLKGKTRDLDWASFNTDPKIVFCGANEDPETFAFPSHIDLFTEPGIRIWCFSEARDPTIVIQWHHACCDGSGILHFLETMLLAYQDIDNNGNAQAVGIGYPVRNQEWWDKRSGCGVSWLNHLRRFPFDLWRVSAYYFNRTTPVQNESALNKSSISNPVSKRFFSFTLTQLETVALIAQAKKHRVTVNDILLTHMFQVIQNWNERFSTELKLRLRIGVPIDHRNKNPVLDPAVNEIGMVFLDRSAKRARNASELLQSIHREMRRVKKWQTGNAMLQILKIAGAFNGGMQRMLAKSVSDISAVLSNYGRQFQNSPLLNQQGKVTAQSLILETIAPFPILRAGVNVGINAITYNEKTTFTLNYDCTQFSISESDSFLFAYISQIKAGI